MLWRLRNRLIVTYVFVGVIPVLLLMAMTSIAFYLFAGQFANFVVDLGPQYRIENPGDTNSRSAIAWQPGASRGHKFVLSTRRFALSEPYFDATGSLRLVTGEKPVPVSTTPVRARRRCRNFFRAFSRVGDGSWNAASEAGTTLRSPRKAARPGNRALDQALLNRVSVVWEKITFML